VKCEGILDLLYNSKTSNLAQLVGNSEDNRINCDIGGSQCI